MKSELILPIATFQMLLLLSACGQNSSLDNNDGYKKTPTALPANPTLTPLPTAVPKKTNFGRIIHDDNPDVHSETFETQHYSLQTFVGSSFQISAADSEKGLYNLYGPGVK